MKRGTSPDDTFIKIKSEITNKNQNVTKRLQEIQEACGQRLTRHQLAGIRRIVESRNAKDVRSKYGRNIYNGRPHGESLSDYIDAVHEKVSGETKTKTRSRCDYCGKILIPDKKNPKYNWTPSSVKYRLYKCRDCKSKRNKYDRDRRSGKTDVKSLPF